MPNITRGRGQRKFAAEINPERSEGFIEASKLPMADRDGKYSAYTTSACS